jgi:hypothetical protein
MAGRPVPTERGTDSPSCRRTTRSPSRCTTSLLSRRRTSCRLTTPTVPMAYGGTREPRLFPRPSPWLQFRPKAGGGVRPRPGPGGDRGRKKRHLLPRPRHRAGALRTPRGSAAERGPATTGRELGGTVGRAVQSQGVLAIATHYVANNAEWLRTGEGRFSLRTSPAARPRDSTSSSTVTAGAAETRRVSSRRMNSSRCTFSIATSRMNSGGSSGGRTSAPPAAAPHPPGSDRRRAASARPSECPDTRSPAPRDTEVRGSHAVRCVT